MRSLGEYNRHSGRSDTSAIDLHHTMGEKRSNGGYYRVRCYCSEGAAFDMNEFSDRR